MYLKLSRMSSLLYIPHFRRRCRWIMWTLFLFISGGRMDGKKVYCTQLLQVVFSRVTEFWVKFCSQWQSQVIAKQASDCLTNQPMVDRFNQVLVCSAPPSHIVIDELKDFGFNKLLGWKSVRNSQEKCAAREKLDARHMHVYYWSCQSNLEGWERRPSQSEGGAFPWGPGLWSRLHGTSISWKPNRSL